MSGSIYIPCEDKHDQENWLCLGITHISQDSIKDKDPLTSHVVEIFFEVITVTSSTETK